MVESGGGGVEEGVEAGLTLFISHAELTFTQLTMLLPITILQTSYTVMYTHYHNIL